MDTVRLNKYLAHATGMSRREADEMISAGRVRLNGAPVEMGAQVASSDIVTLDDTVVNIAATRTYLMLNKPVGYVSSRRQQGDNPTLYDLLPQKYHELKPVGRLDRDSSGLLLLTNDGDFAHRLTHPSFRKTKSYEITLDKNLEPLHRQMISDYGVQLDDGPSKLQLDRMHDGDETQWRVSMHEGRNRQIRRTFTALGYTVTKLHRTNFGSYSLGDLKPGEIREIEAK